MVWFDFQLQKGPSSIDITDAGIVMEDMDVHSLKAYSPIFVTELGMFIEVNA